MAQDIVAVTSDGIKVHRCKKCNKFLLRSDCIDAVAICPRCKHENCIRYFTQEALLKLKML